MKNILFIILAFIILSASSFSEKKSYKMDDLDNAFGVKLSNISGYGVYYTRKINDDFKVQLMGMIFYYQSVKTGEDYKNFNYDIGLELQRNIYQDHNSRFYILAGAYYYYDDDHTINSLFDEDIFKNSYNVGVGITYEYFWNRILFSFDAGYKFFEDRISVRKLKPTVENYPELNRVTKLGGGIGIGFMF